MADDQAIARSRHNPCRVLVVVLRLERCHAGIRDRNENLKGTDFLHLYTSGFARGCSSWGAICTT